MGQDVRSVPENKNLTSNPLLCALLKANSPDYSPLQYFKNTITTADIEHDTSSHKRHNCQNVKSLPPVLNGEPTKAEKLDRLGGTNLTYCQPPFSFSSPSGQMANQPPTDDQIWDYIKKRLACYTSGSTPQRITTSEGDRDSTLQLSSVAHLPTPVSEEYVERQSLRCSVMEQYSIAERQAVKDVSLSPKTTVASEKQTEYPQIISKVAATCTKNEDESQVVLTAVPPVALDELTKKCCNNLFHCASIYKEYKSPFSNINQNLDEIDNVPGFYWAVKSITEQEERDIDPKLVEAIGLNNVQGVNDVSEAFQCEPSLMIHKNGTSFLKNQDATTKLREIYDPQPCHITCKEVTAHSKINSSIQIVNVVSLHANQQLRKKSCEDARKDAGLVHSQRDLGVALSENEQPSKSENEHEQTSSVNNMKDPQYEDISDYEDTSQLLAKLPNSEQEELRLPACFEDVQYEDISEDENPQILNIAVETASLKKLSENNSKQLTFEKEGDGHVQSQAQLKTKVNLDEKLLPKKQQTIGIMDTDQLSSISSLVKIADGIEQLSHPKCDCGRPLECQTNCSSLCSCFSVLKNETDDQMDDYWIVFPISISDLKFEPQEEAQSDPGVIVLQDSDTESIKSLGDTSPKVKPASDPGPASVHYQIEEFDTLESFLLSKTAQFRRSSRVSPTKEMNPMTEPHKAQNRRESYSEDNYETDDSCNYSPAPEHNYLTVTSHLLKSPAPVTSDKGDSAPKKEREHEATHPQIGQMRHSGLQTLKELMDTRAGSKHVQPNCNKQNISKKDDIIILDSDTEDESDQNSKKTAKRMRVSSSSEDRGDLSCSRQRGHLLKTVDNVGETFKEKLQENTAQQCQSKLETIIQNISPQDSVIILDSDLEDESDKNYQKANHKVLFVSGLEGGGKIRKTEQLTEPKGDSDCIQEVKGQTTSQRAVFHSSDKVGKKDLNHKKKATMERILSSESDNSDSASFNIQNRHSAETMNSVYRTTSEKPQRKTLLFKESPDKVPQSVGKEADSTSDHNPVITRLYVQKESQCGKYFKLQIAKDSKGTFCKDETQPLKSSTTTSKKTDSLDLDKNGQDRCVPKPKSHCKNNRQPPLSNQEGPSTSISCLTSPDGQLSEIQRSSASSKDLSLSAESSAFNSFPKSRPCTSDPAYLRSSKLKRSLSYSNTSKLDSTPSPTQGPPSSATIQLPAKRRAVEDWCKSYVPLRRDRRSSLGTESSRNTSYITNRNARSTSRHSDRAPRQRHNSHKSTTPLMKRTKFEAIQRTKEINRDTSRERRSSMGKGCDEEVPIPSRTPSVRHFNINYGSFKKMGCL